MKLSKQSQNTHSQWKYKQKESNTQVLVFVAWQKWKAQSRVWIVQNDVHIAETLTKESHSYEWKFCSWNKTAHVM